VAVLLRIENYPPGRLRRPQRAVSAVFKREGRRAEQDTFTAGGRNSPTAGRIGIPYVEPGARRGFHRLCDNTPPRTEPGDMEHVHVRAEEFRLPQRQPPVEHLKERAPADSRVHSSPMPLLIPSQPPQQRLQRAARPGTCSPSQSRRQDRRYPGGLDSRELFDAAVAGGRSSTSGSSPAAAHSSQSPAVAACAS